MHMSSLFPARLNLACLSLGLIQLGNVGSCLDLDLLVQIHCSFGPDLGQACHTIICALNKKAVTYTSLIDVTSSVYLRLYHWEACVSPIPVAP